MIRSVRATTLLALVVAVACTDQPTEPTKSETPFQAVLGPPPAPPTALSAGFPAANGAPSLQELGFYEAPTIARVTVSGLLNYSNPDGAGSGYLPGSGAIDAEGIYVPQGNFCALQLSVRVTGFGRIGGYDGTSCPHIQQVGSLTTYAVVSGQIVAQRLQGPPGSCFFGGFPCTTITGEQQVEVVPETADLALTSLKTEVGPGGLILVVANPSPAFLHGIAVPWSLREWRWEGSGPTVGGGQTKVCSSVPTANSCYVTMYQSGNVVLEAVVNGTVRTQRMWLRVTGGDSVPPQPPDSVPPDSIPPSDTTHGGGGSGGGGGGCPSPVKGPFAAAAADSSCSPTRPDSIKILRFAVPGRGADSGSFTSMEGENDIRVYARAWPETFSSRIKYRVSDYPNDAFIIALPTTFISDSGAMLEFHVPVQDTSRFAEFEDIRPLPDTSWKPKALGYRVEAYVTDSGGTVTSPSFDVRQDELDVLREEYIELLAHRTTSRHFVPGRSDFSELSPSFPGENDGESYFRMNRAAFRAGVDTVKTEFLKVPRDGFQINEVFRSPVDNLWHTTDHDDDSWHMYGCAADLQTFPVGQTGARDTTTVAYRNALAYWTALAATARRLKFSVEDLEDSKIGHVHVQRNCYP